MIGPLVTDGVDKMRKLVETIRKGDGNTTKELGALKQAIELQSAFNKRVDDQLRLIESVLNNVQKSLKILAFTSAVVGVVAVTALVLAMMK